MAAAAAFQKRAAKPASDDEGEAAEEAPVKAKAEPAKAAPAAAKAAPAPAKAAVPPAAAASKGKTANVFGDEDDEDDEALFASGAKPNGTVANKPAASAAAAAPAPAKATSLFGDVNDLDEESTTEAAPSKPANKAQGVFGAADEDDDDLFSSKVGRITFSLLPRRKKQKEGWSARFAFASVAQHFPRSVLW